MEQKFEALKILMAHYPVGKDFKLNEADVFESENCPGRRMVDKAK